MPHEALQRRKDLLVREVAGDAEYYERIRRFSWPRRSLASGAARALDVAAELAPHRREQAVREIVVVARAEAREQRRREHGHRHAGVDGRVDRPASLAGVRDLAEKAVERRDCARAPRS